MFRMFFLVFSLISILQISCNNEMTGLVASKQGVLEERVDSSTALEKAAKLDSRLVGQSVAFYATKFADANIHVDVDHGVSSETIKMDYDSKVEKLDLKQKTREKISKRFTQGKLGIAKTDSNVLSTETYRDLDILVVVDDSGSMRDEQEKLSTRLPEIISAVEDTNWRIGIIHTGLATTSTSTYTKDGACLVNLLKKETYDPDMNLASEVFQNTISELGISGDAQEQGILKAVLGLKQELFCPHKPAYSNWVRENSFVAVLIVSDEDNCNSGTVSTTCKEILKSSHAYSLNTESSTPVNFTKYLNSKTTDFYKDFIKNHLHRTAGEDAKVFALVKTDSTCTDAYALGTAYMGLVAATGGQTGSICPDATTGYKQTLEEMSKDISKIVIQNAYELSEIPSPDSDVEVIVDGQKLQSSDFVVKDKFVTITNKGVLNENSTNVSVSYRYGSTRSKEFQLDPIKPAVESSIAVKIGTTQIEKTGNWTYNKDTNKIVFTNYPEEDAQITVSYSVDGDLSTDFDFSNYLNLKSGEKIENPKVLVNNQVSDTSKYNVINGGKGVRFLNDFIPSEGTSVSLSFTRKTPRLSYSSSNAEAKSISLKNERGEDVSFRKDRGNLIINLTNFKEGGKLIYQFEDLSSTKGKVRIAHDIILDSLHISGDGNREKLDVKDSDWEKQSSTLNLDSKLIKNQRSIEISYIYIVERYQKFTLDQIDPNHRYNWKVSVQNTPNSQEVLLNQSQYEIQGNSIVLNDLLPLDAIVSINAYREVVDTKTEENNL